MALHDVELIQRTLAGDESAFGFLVDKYKGSVHALAYRKLGDFHTAEEITQDTFLKAYQKLSTLKDPGRFPGWLYVIAARCCISWLRQNRLQTEPFDSAKEEINMRSWTKYADARVYEDVHDALESLPESERTVLTLYYMAGMTCEEIGRFIGTSCGAIRDRLYRARMHLKEELTMIEETLRGFQLPPSLTQEIMRQIPNGSLNSAPTSKPLVPWIAAASLTVVALVIGLGIKQATTFQLPYSFNAPKSATTVEIVDAPVIEMPLSKLSQVNQAGEVNGRESGNRNQGNDSVQGTAADPQNDIESDNIGWTQTNGPYGGTVMSLHATPEGTLFAGTSGAGIFRSTDGGDTWVSASEGLQVPPYNRLPSLPVLTQEGNTLYTSTNSNLFYSIDNGDSWQQLAHFRDEMVGISGVALIGDTIYIGRHIEESVFCSNDNGKSWTQIDSGLTDRMGPSLIASGTTLFAQMRDYVFRLKAGEQSWTKLTFDDPRTKNTVEPSIRGFAVSDKMLYAATADGNLFRSTNMGNSWESIKPKSTQHSYDALTAVENTVFYINDGRVFRSTDAGNSWRMFNTNLTNQSILSITALSEKILYVGTLNGVFRSTDGGESWRETNTGIINTHIENLIFFKNALYAVTDDGIVKSADGGNSWRSMNEGLVADDWATLTVSGGKLYAATNGTNYNTQNLSTSGVYRLADDENSWVPIQTNMQSANDGIDGVNQLMVSGETFYAVEQTGDGARLYRWRVGEDLWTQLRTQDLFSWGTLAVSGRTVYVSAVRGKLFRSVDEGDTWTEVSQNLPGWGQEIGSYDLVFIGETIYAKAGSGGGRSTDGGETWTPIIVAGLPGGYIQMQLVDGTTLYGTSSHGLFRLTQESDSWERIAPTQRDVMALAYDGTTFYIGTSEEGVFRLSLDE